MATAGGDPPTAIPNRTMKNSRKPRKTSKTTHPIEDSPQLPNLPEGIIVDIFSRLPVKSLLKFRCVSKSWLSLISDPYFIKKHLHISSTDPNYHNHRVILFRKHPNFDMRSLSLYSIYSERCADVTDLNNPFDQNLCRNDTIVGSCNGLLCIVINQDIIYLWNPSTRETRRLPQFGFIVALSVSYIVYGFGYDSSHDDYKLMVTLYRRGRGSYNAGEAYMYTSSTNSWRRIEKCPIELPAKPGIFVGGSLIWSAVDFGDFPGPLHVYWKIVAFDLANETYQEVPQPMREDGAYDNTLGVLGGCLCLLANYHGTHSDLWVMKDFGVKESWTKFITIPYCLNLWYLDLLLCLTPMWFSKKGELLAKIKSVLGFVDTKNNTMYSGTTYFHSSLQSSVYIESLVSPNLSLGVTGSTNSGRKMKQTSRVGRVDEFPFADF